uniref:hypothetical protein n=1 Tax=Curtobacterium pusillum TaxID=69373 RepID=UPI001C92BE8B
VRSVGGERGFVGRMVGGWGVVVGVRGGVVEELGEEGGGVGEVVVVGVGGGVGDGGGGALKLVESVGGT